VHKFIIAGRLGSKPELKQGCNYSMTSFNVASPKTVKKGESWEKTTAWNRVTIFGKKAELVVKYLDKGSYAIFEGNVETVKNKENNYVTNLTVTEVEFGPAINVASNKQNPGFKENESFSEIDDVPF
jgi:single-strand DNA-binding protein